MTREGQVAVITGGTGGLGKTVVETLLNAGSTVVLPYRNEKEKAALLALMGSKKSNLFPFEADVTREEQVQALWAEVRKRWLRLDVLVNLVGGYASGKTIADTEEKELDQMISLNLKSAFFCCKHTLPLMTERNYGRIINISAKAAVSPMTQAGPYCISKAAVLTLTQVLASEVKSFNITANAILPSIIDTEANREAMPKADFKKWVAPAEIAKTILYLTSEEASGINGAAVPVYGRV